MFDTFITEEDILAQEGINGDTGEGQTDDEHNDGSNTGEALEGVEHLSVGKRFRVGQ